MDGDASIGSFIVQDCLLLLVMAFCNPLSLDGYFAQPRYSSEGLPWFFLKAMFLILYEE